MPMYASAFRPAVLSVSNMSKMLLQQTNPGVSVSIGKKTKLFSSVKGISNTFIEVSCAKNKAQINYERLTKALHEKVMACNTGKEKEWFQEEKTSLLSSEVNRTIDLVCRETSNNFREQDRNIIFNKMTKLLDVELDPRCTQSSIKQALLGNKYLMKKIDAVNKKEPLAPQKNARKNFMVDQITDRIFEKEFGGVNLSTLRNKVAQETMRMVISRG